MTREEFKKYGHEIVDWMAQFYEEIETYPVRSQAGPKDVLGRLPKEAPEKGEPFESLLEDFRSIILPGITHWQHPSFFAYFPANGSFPSILGEMLTAALGAQCMIWQTSPAAAELEERVMEWLIRALGLPEDWEGVIQDSASSSTLAAILTAREKKTDFAINERGVSGEQQLRVYCSEETHSSIDKAVKIAGIGAEHIRKVEVDHTFAMKPELLRKVIAEDIASGYTPCCCIATLGTTGSTAIDPVKEIAEICEEHGIWLHIDAALAGTALLLPDYRWMIEGIEKADSFVFNPHKWMFTNFDCSAYFVKNSGDLIRTFEIHPEYLKTKEGKRVKDYRDWGVQLGRRFRALKLWFVLRSFGLEGIREKVGFHIGLAQDLSEEIAGEEDFELLAPVPLNTICFRYLPPGIKDVEEINRINAEVLERVNATGKAFFTHTKLRGKYTIRFVIGQSETRKEHVRQGWELIKETARLFVES
jgi:aromatic-L-amino-acid/L-tryptophan decarboxylase